MAINVINLHIIILTPETEMKIAVQALRLNTL